MMQLAEHVAVLNASYQRLLDSTPQTPPAAVDAQPNSIMTKGSTSPTTDTIAPLSATPSKVARNTPPAGGALLIDEVDQVRSERVSPRDPALQLVANCYSNSDREDIPGGFTTPPRETIQHHSGKASAAELQLYRAAERICVDISGVDYRQVAQQAHKACDLVTKMIFEDVTLAKRSDWVPSYLVARQADRLRALFRESKELLVLNSIAVPAAMDRIANAEAPISPSSSGSNHNNINNNNRQRTVSLDASATGGGKGVHRADGGTEPLVPAADEAYDVRLMHSAFDDRSDPRTRELEDEVMVLKSRLDKLHKERKELLGTVERQEQQLASMRTKLTKETEVFYQTHRQMEADLRQLAVTTGHQELLDGEEGDGVVGPAEQRPNSVPYAATRSPPHSLAPRPTLTPTTPIQPVPPTGLPHTASARSPVVQGDVIVRPTSTDDMLQLQQQGKGDGGSHHPTLISPIAASGGSGKYNRLDTLYRDIYRGKGIEFLMQAMDLVFKMEYDVAHNNGDELLPSRPTTAPEGNRAVLSGSTNSTESSALRTPLLQAAHERFMNDLQTHVIGKLSNFTTFREVIAESTPLRSEYVAQCVQMRSKPNSGIVALLSTIAEDSEVTELNLSGNYVGDSGLTPLLPLLQRLYRLRSLRLADNGLKNQSILALCHAVRTHPSLTEIDLSRNSITRAAGRELLGLVATMPLMRHIDVNGTMIDEPLVQKIKTRLEINVGGGPSPTKSQQGGTASEDV